MRLIKLGMISIVAFSILLFLFSLVIPSTVRVSRAVNIHAEKTAILPFLIHQDKWKDWNVFANEKIDVTVEMVDTAMITTVWKYKDQAINSYYWLEESTGISVVQWYFEFRLKWYPWEKFGSITFDKQFGPAMEQSLNNLKKQIENSP